MIQLLDWFRICQKIGKNVKHYFAKYFVKADAWKCLIMGMFGNQSGACALLVVVN